MIYLLFLIIMSYLFFLRLQLCYPLVFLLFSVLLPRHYNGFQNFIITAVVPQSNQCYQFAFKVVDDGHLLCVEYPHLVSVIFQSFVSYAEMWKRAELSYTFMYCGLCLTCGRYAEFVKHISNLLFQIFKSLVKPSIPIDHTERVFVQIPCRHQYRWPYQIPLV